MMMGVRVMVDVTSPLCSGRVSLYLTGKNIG